MEESAGCVGFDEAEKECAVDLGGSVQYASKE